MEEKLGMAPFVAGAARIYIVVTIFLNIFQDGFGCLFVSVCEYLGSTISKVTLWVLSTVQIVPEGPRWVNRQWDSVSPKRAKGATGSDHY